MKRTNQINGSKEAITLGFLELIAIRPYQEITISEISKQSKVARMTFYRHFKSKEELFTHTLEGYLRTAVQEMSALEKPTLLDLLICRFRIIKSSPLADALLADDLLGSIFYDFGKNNFSIFSEILPQKQDPYTSEFAFGGIRALTAQWIANGMTESPEEMASRANSLLLRVCK